MVKFIGLIIFIFFLQSCASHETVKKINIKTSNSENLNLNLTYEFSKAISSTYDLKGIALHPSKNILFSYGKSNKVTLYNAKTLDVIEELESKNHNILALTISKDGNYLAIGGDTDGFFSSKSYIEVWDLSNYKKVRSIKSDNTVYTLSFSSNNKRIASAGEGQDIYIWNIETAKENRHFKSQSDYAMNDDIIHVKFIDEDTLISMSKNKRLEKWNIHVSPTELKYSYVFQFGDKGKINKVKITDKYIILAFMKVSRAVDSAPKWSHFLTFYDYRGEPITPYNKHKRLITSFDINRNIMVSTSEDKTIQIYDLEKKEYVVEFKLERQGKDICLNNNLIIVLEGKRNIKTWSIHDSFFPKVEKKKSITNVNRYALVVALDNYQNSSIPTLENAVSDAREVKKILEEKGFRVFSLYNENATKENIIKAIRKMKEASIDKSSILFYFSGHGMGITVKNSIREGYIIPYDFNSSIYVPKKLDDFYYKKNSISITSLVNTTMDGEAQNIALLLDSCFSGLAMTAYPSAKSVNILTAGTDKEVSDGTKHSPFAKAFIKKLTIPSKECLSFFSLSDYVSNVVKRETKNKQVPQFKANRENIFCF